MKFETIHHHLLDAALYLPRLGIRSLARMGQCPFSNERGLARLNDLHRGKRGVIIGMGPSLQLGDLQRLGDAVTFGCNKLFLAYPQTTFRPDYYSVLDTVTADNVKSELLECDLGQTLPIHSRINRSRFRSQPNALFFDYCGNLQRIPLAQAWLPRNLAGGILGGGYTVAISMIQLAYAMGCEEVYLIGVNFSYQMPGTPASAAGVSGATVSQANQQNHFMKNYYRSGERWTVPNYERMRYAYHYCAEAFAKSGRKLWNASRKTELDVVPRCDFDQVFPE